MRSLISTISLFLLVSCTSTSKTVNMSTEPATSAAPKGNTSISWKPNVLVNDFHIESSETFRNVEFSFKPLSDSRAEKANIGSINYNGQPKTVIPKANICSWCTTNLKNCFKFLELKPTSKSGSFSFEGEITAFNINQDITMHSMIALSLSCSKDGLTVWEGSVQGNSELYVIPSGSDGVSECLSNTLINAAYNLLNDKSFVDAVSKSKE